MHQDRRVDQATAARYRSAGWWGDETVSGTVRRLARAQPERPAFVADGRVVDYRGYDQAAERVAGALVAAGLAPGERLAVQLPDGATAHAVYVGAERAGLVTVGIGARAGSAELRSIVDRSGASALVTLRSHQGEVVGNRHLVVPEFEEDPDGDVELDGRPVAGRCPPGRALGPDDLFMINSTSGTTGLPKCVMHAQNSKFYMAKQAREVADLQPGEVIMGCAPIPYGFGLFTTHFLAVLLGGTAVVASRFDAQATLEQIERQRATVLVCVTTQFKMMLKVDGFERYDLSSLKVMFTGGEMIPYDAARSFEARTGAAVLNFYGSNESGFATGTRLDHPADRRLRTAGSFLPGTEVRLFNGRRDVTASGRGQPGSRGPATSLGYYADPAANAELFTPDGFVLHADVVEIDVEGFLTVVGRKSELIIRGGKNVSAAAVEEAVSAHPAVRLAAAVPMPDPLFGERVCVYVELGGGSNLDLAELVDFLAAAGVSKEQFPEHLVVLEELPRASGGKVAKGVLREDAARRAAEAAAP